MGEQGKKTIFYIDGNNVYKTFYKNGFRLKAEDYPELVKMICNGFKEHHSLVLSPIQTRYYNSVPSIEDGKELYERHMKFIQDLANLGVKIITRKLQRSSNWEVIEEKNEILKNLNICKNCEPIVKKNCLECVGTIKKREKGIDISIATDMISGAFRNEFDFCVLISGDADFIPALDLVKALNKTPLSSFLLGYNKRENSYAFNLRTRFRSYFFTKENLETSFPHAIVLRKKYDPALPHRSASHWGLDK
jgi:uncharacterized LabA/DUF88 family protein